MPGDDFLAEPQVDWEQLAARLDAVESVNTRDGQLALAAIVGADRLRASVDWYVEGRPGSELARFALWRLQPPAARDRCVEIWRSSTEPLRRQLAVELLRVVATAEDLHLVSELLADSDPSVQAWGIGVLDQLIWSHQVEAEEAAPLLEIAASHANPQVRERGGFIREVLRDREAVVD